MTTLKSLALALSITASALASGGCKSNDSCDAIVEHSLTLMPKEFAEAAKKDKASMIKKCEELPKEARACALAAKTLAELTSCSGKHGA